MPARRAPVLLLIALGAFAAALIVSSSLHITPRSEAVSRGLVLASSPAPAPLTAGRPGAITSFADIAAAALPAVVSITSRGVVTEAADQQAPGDLFEFFFGPRGRGARPGEPRSRRTATAGSGFIISDSGWVLTNNHVVSGASEIQVTLTSREVYKAKVVGTDPAIDVALLKIDAPKKLPALALGDSDRMRVADPVMAIGNPLQFAGTVTVGVLSAKGRTGISDDPTSASLQDLLQTDAAINFGNSGGPLLNANAEVIGINTAMIQPAQNIGFAVSINSVKAILPQLEKTGKVERGMLGVRIGPIDQDIQKAFQLPSMDGAFVESVDAGKPADKAGIKPGDAIVQADDSPVREPRDVIRIVTAKRPGQEVHLVVLRSGRRISVTASLAPLTVAQSERAEDAGDAGTRRGGERLGISVSELTPEIRQEIGAARAVSGIVVAEVREDSPAADQGLAPGDVITEANGVKIGSVSQFRDELKKVKSGDYIRLYVRRFQPQEVSRFVIIKTG